MRGLNKDLKKEKQMKQRGSAPHLPIRGYRPHPSDRWKRRFYQPFPFG